MNLIIQLGYIPVQAYTLFFEQDCGISVNEELKDHPNIYCRCQQSRVLPWGLSGWCRRCFEPDVAMTAGSFSGAIISCQSFGHLWMYCVCLFGVEYQGRDDMLCATITQNYQSYPLKASSELLWRLLCFPSVMIHCVCSNTQTPLNKHHLCLTFSCAILNLYKWDKGRKVFLNVSAFIKNLEVILKCSSHSVGYCSPWIKLNWIGQPRHESIQNL